MFKRILIANRGEIALRIIRTCKRLGVAAVAVYSEVDFRAPFVRLADDRTCIGPAPAPESYLVKEKIIQAAKDCNCDAIHPGYGFLSENPEFARMVREAGLAFIGPTPEAIALLGDKPASKQLAIKANVPVVPGHNEPLSDSSEALKVAEKVGFPILLKPAAGGGGRGMRIVTRGDELLSAFEACKDETRKGFGDERIFLERYVSKPRHIEIQIMADHHGNVIHLGERECSIQRRYQKVIEEAPSVALTPELRKQMGSVACNLAKAAGYTNAGTVEFILDEDKNFYFLEMNTRLQVEHPVTEEVTSLDLVELQFRIAEGEPLPLTQDQVQIKGWAIEARICAEDPLRGFYPTTGMVTRYGVSLGQGVRVDSGVDAGSMVTIHYDSLMAKVIAWGDTRDQAIKRLVGALNGYHIEGLLTNVDFANALVDHPSFAAGDLSTHFIDEHFKDGERREPPDPEKVRTMVIAVVLIHHARRTLVRDSLRNMSPVLGRGAEMQTKQEYIVKSKDDVFHVDMLKEVDDDRHWSFSIDKTPYDVRTPQLEFFRRRLKLRINDTSHMFRIRYQEHHIKAFHCGIVRMFEIYTPPEWNLAQFMRKKETDIAENELKCPMPGLVTTVSVSEGEFVRRGQELFRIESMKMESSIISPFDAVVEKVLVTPGKDVETNEILLIFNLDAEEAPSDD